MPIYCTVLVECVRATRCYRQSFRRTTGATARRKICFEYVSLKEQRTKRAVRPLCLAFFGPVWLLTEWCETRDDFRNFRLDRMRRLDVADDQFRDEAGKRLSDFLRQEREKR